MRKVEEGVWFVEAENKGRYPYAHSLFLENDERILIDTGAGKALKDLVGITDQVVLTHFHRDHVSGNALFNGICFSIHHEDAPGVESEDGFFRLSGINRDDLQSYWNYVKPPGFSVKKLDRYLKDGDEIGSGGLNAKVLHLPGHTPGHCGILVEKYNLVFATDIDLSRFGPWYGNAYSDLDHFRWSIKRLRDLKPDILITSHSEPIRDSIGERFDTYASVLDERDEVIVETLKKGPLTLEQLTAQKIIYRRHYGQNILIYFERMMIFKHLASLLKRNIIVESTEGYEVC